MTRDEAMKVWREADRAGEDAYVEAIQAGAVTADDAHKAGLLAAATVIQQAFAEREVGMIEALKPFAHYYRLNDCEGRPDDDAIEVPIGDLRFAALALAAKGDSRG